MKGKICSIVGSLILFVPLHVLAVDSASYPFSDVPADSPLALATSFLKEKNIIRGFSDGSYHPERLVTRAEALAMILNATGSSKMNAKTDLAESLEAGTPFQISLPKETTVTLENMVTGEKKTLQDIDNLQIHVEDGSGKLKIMKKKTKKPFMDVSQSDWFFDMTNEARRLGIIKGVKTENGVFFRPHDYVNLAEALRMIFQSAKISTALSEEPLPPGVPADAWYAKDMAQAMKMTILMQQENGAIFPAAEKLHRGEMAVLLYRFMKSQQDGAMFGYASWYGDGLAKTKLKTGIEYAERHLTAAHKTLPIGSIMRVTNVVNGKQVDVVINDRGPYVTGRIIDLSRSAFSALEDPGTGVIAVQLETME